MAKRKMTNGQEEFEDTKGVITIHKSKKDRQHNGQKKKDRGWTQVLRKGKQWHPSFLFRYISGTTTFPE